MPKKALKNFMPSLDKIKSHKHLRIFGDLIDAPNLWHINRYSVSRAVAIGLFIAFVPLPIQMLLAAGAAILLHANVALSVLFVWISNPLTMPVLYFGAYKLGTLILGSPTQNIDFELSLSWLTNELLLIWKPFLLGCFICGVVSALIGKITFRLYWRWHVIRHWRARQKKIALKRKNK